MKTSKLFLIIALFSSLFFVESCTKNNCQEPTLPVTQYALNKSIVEINTTNVSTGFETVFSKTISDSTSRAQFSQAFVDAARFYDDNSGYFFIETLPDAWVVAHINHDLIGTSRINIQDENGKYFIQQMVETVQYTGFGFVEYYRKNPSTDISERKLSFVTSIPSANWFIGTGFYGDPEKNYYSEEDANKIIIKEATLTMAKGIAGIFNTIYPETNDRIAFCRDFIDHIRFFDNGSGYFFINDLDGINIAHGANPARQGKNDSDIQDTHGAYIIRDMIKIVNSSGAGYYQYYWNDPASGKEKLKETYVIRIPDTDYFIGAGFYLD